MERRQDGLQTQRRVRPGGRASWRCLPAVAMVLALAGCVSKPQLTPIPAGESVVLTAPQATVAARIGTQADVAATAALMAGALPLSVGCIHPICLAGAAAGGVIAGGVYVAGKLTSAYEVGDPAVTTLHDRVRDALTPDRLPADMLADMRRLAEPVWTVADAGKGNALTVQVVGHVDRAGAGKACVSLQAKVQVRYVSSRGSTRQRNKPYVYQGACGSLQAWNDPDSGLLSTTLQAGGQQLATQIVADLTPRNSEARR